MVQAELDALVGSQDDEIQKNEGIFCYEEEYRAILRQHQVTCDRDRGCDVAQGVEVWSGEDDIWKKYGVLGSSSGFGNRIR